MAKKIFWSTLTLVIATVIGVGAGYVYFRAQVLKLETHYPMWTGKEYKLVKYKPSYWVREGLVSKSAKWAIIISEDWPFFQHQGIDVDQIQIAIEQSIEQKRLVRGASTITQQVIKNVFLTNERSLLRKGKEVILALIMEQYLSKKKILELYLNIIELGEGIRGIKPASFYYFNKPPSLLDAKEGAFLAMLLPSPIRYGHSFRERKLTKYAKEQIERVLLRLRQAKVITEEQRLMHLNDVLSFETRAENLIDEDILGFENEKYE